MNNRESIEKREYEFLSPLACHAAESKGRQFDEEQCEYRTDFQRDRDRIVHSKAFRRLIHKTQVFLAPEGDHYRTRLTHTLEVQQIARTIARILAYNEDLTEAIALGHDLGHTPFGHVGEKVLNKIHPGGFEHNVQSLRTVDIIEDTSRRRGLNLTYEVRDGILNHRGPVTPATLEGQIVKISDRIAYINHDIDDAIRSGALTFEQLPEREVSILGSTHADRINNLIVEERVDGRLHVVPGDDALAWEVEHLLSEVDPGALCVLDHKASVEGVGDVPHVDRSGSLEDRPDDVDTRLESAVILTESLHYHGFRMFHDVEALGHEDDDDERQDSENDDSTVDVSHKRYLIN